MTYNEIIYMCLDEVKANSDDDFITEEHVLFLINKYRSYILNKTYSDVKKQIPESNYQTICLDLEESNAIDGDICTGGTYLKSTKKIPQLLSIGNPQIYPIDYFQGNITYISKDRMKYIGFNKYLKNIVYTCIGPDNYLYFKSNNPQHKYLEKVKFTGVFEDSITAAEMECDEEKNNICSIFDRTVNIEEALVPTIIELIVKELLGIKYQPKDIINDAAAPIYQIDKK